MGGTLKTSFIFFSRVAQVTIRTDKQEKQLVLQ